MTGDRRRVGAEDSARRARATAAAAIAGDRPPPGRARRGAPPAPSWRGECPAGRSPTTRASPATRRGQSGEGEAADRRVAARRSVAIGRGARSGAGPKAGASEAGTSVIAGLPSTSAPASRRGRRGRPSPRRGRRPRTAPPRSGWSARSRSPPAAARRCGLGAGRQLADDGADEELAAIATSRDAKEGTEAGTRRRQKVCAGVASQVRIRSRCSRSGEVRPFTMPMVTGKKQR